MKFIRVETKSLRRPVYINPAAVASVSDSEFLMENFCTVCFIGEGDDRLDIAGTAEEFLSQLNS